MRIRRDELRDYRGTFMLNHELMKEEVDLSPWESGREHIRKALLEPRYNGTQRQTVQGPRAAGAQTGLREPSNLLTRESKYLESHTDN